MKKQILRNTAPSCDSRGWPRYWHVSHLSETKSLKDLLTLLKTWAGCFVTTWGTQWGFTQEGKMGKWALRFGQWSVHRHREDSGWFPGHETLTSLKQIIILSEERNMPIKTVLVGSRDIVKQRRGGKHVKCLGKLCPGANGLQVFWSYCKASDHNTWLI